MSMTPVSRISVTTPHPMRRAGDIVVERTVEPVQALTPTEPVTRVIPAALRISRPDPAFIAHLLATAEQVPQTRALRRADAGDVDAAYRKAASLYGAGASRVSRVV